MFERVTTRFARHRDRTNSTKALRCHIVYIDQEPSLRFRAWDLEFRVYWVLVGYKLTFFVIINRYLGSKTDHFLIWPRQGASSFWDYLIYIYIYLKV